MAGQVVGGEVNFTGPQAGQAEISEDAMEAGLRELMLSGTDGSQINLRAPTEQEYLGASSQSAPQVQGGISFEDLEAQEQGGFQPNGVPTGYMLVDKQKFGDSENEKGTLRSQVAEKEAALANALATQNMLLQQFQTLQAQPPQQPAFQSPFYGGRQEPPRLFRDKPGHDVTTADEVESVMLPYMAEAWNQNQLAQQRINTLEAQLLATRKASAGITPLVEMQLTAENPSLQMIQGPAKIDLMVSLLAAKRQVEAARAPAQPQVHAPIQATPVQTAMRRVTYVEGANPTTLAPQYVNPQAQMDAEWRATYTLPLEGGKRAAAQQALMLKWGAQKHSGYRDPSVLTS